MRPLEDHLSPHELTSLPKSPEELATGEPEQLLILQHLQRCGECMNLAQDYWRLRQFRAASGAGTATNERDCSLQSDWLEFAADLSGNRSESMAAHAAVCAGCFQMLKEAIELVGGQPAEVDLGASSLNLASSTPKWQQRVAAQMAAIASASQTHQKDTAARPSMTWKGRLRQLWTPRIALPVSAALALSIGAAAFVFFRTRHEDLDRTNQLIAQAYAQQRTLPFRFPGAHYGPLRVTRGGESSHAERPIALLQAETQIASQQQRGNKDRQWLLAAANADLLEGDYDHAVQILEAGASESPNIPEIDITIATAYYERGVQNHTSDDLGKAREAIGRALDKEPQNFVALFNRALIDEGMGLYTQAISDWQQYLLLDTADEWSQEAREHLTNCQQIKEKKEKVTDGQSLLTPGAISDLGASKVADSDIDSHIEDYQVRVFTSYYPALTGENSSPKAPHNSIEEETIRRLGEISAFEHNDRLLQDLIASGNFSQARIPAKELASAIAANHAGDEQQALDEAKKASAGFERIGNRAGSLRAQFEMLYALQFMSRTSECAIRARRLAAIAHQARYAWLIAEAETQAGFCGNMTGDLSGAAEELKRAAQDARDAKYEAALDRALVGAGAMQFQAGSITASWDLALTGIKHFWASSVPYERGESFCDLLDGIAEQQRQWHLQSAVLMESLSLLERRQDRLAVAQLLVRLAGSQLMLHRSDEAKHSLAKALLIFRSAPQTPATLNQELMVRINLAKAEAASHDYLSSVSQLEQLRPQLGQLHEDLSLIEFYTTLGEAYRKLGNETKAAKSDLAAIGIFRTGLSSLNRVRDRLTWYRQVSSAYRSLVQLLINQNKTAEALRIWQEYRRTGLLPELNHVPTRSKEPQIDKPEELQTTIVYANLPDELFAWAVSGQQIKAAPIGASFDAISQLENAFSDECSSPNSDIAALFDNGKQLYRILIEPFADLLTEDRIALIEPDDELARIPFSALIDGQGRYLNITHTIAIAPFSAALARSTSSRKPLDSRDAGLLVENRSSDSSTQREDFQSAREIQMVASFFPKATILRSEMGAKHRFLRLLKRTTIFHYAGHSATSGNGGGLVLQELNPAGREHSIFLRSDDLEGTRLEHGKLAVLSACQTDRGQGEHWLDRDNVALTLLGAGFPEIVASRWDIDSGATTTLMQAFYANISKGLSVPNSLRNAAEQTRQMPEYHHPYFWAAFSVLERSGIS